MNCEDFQKAKGTGLGNHTRGEKAALLQHYLKCDGCQKLAKEALANETPAEYMSAMLATATEINELVADPECRHVVPISLGGTMEFLPSDRKA
jgi:hypothetical protein